MAKLSKEAMREYQRNRRKALQIDVKPECKANVNLSENVKPNVNLCKAVKPECDNCKAEYKRGYQVGYDKAKAENVSIASSGDTIYEPDPVKPVKQAKISTTKHVAPVVQAMLSRVRKQPTVAHHPTCTCAMCKQPKGQAYV